MRHINNRDVEDLLHEEWHDRASAAVAEVAASPSDAERRKLLGKGRFQSIWRDASAALGIASSKKCWYCEVRDTRSDMPVDHFRPKGRVAEEFRVERSPKTGKMVKAWTHSGYWWLAFDWSNFRLSCTFCNSIRKDPADDTVGGKQDHFPLCSGSQRAWKADDDLGLERPMLLDPCNPADPPLLTFRQDGHPVPRHVEDANPKSYERAAVSIQLYHLDHSALRKRRKELWNKVEELVGRGTRLLDEGQGIDDVKLDLTRLILSSEPMACVARTALRGLRDRPWVNEWLEDVVTTL